MSFEDWTNYPTCCVHLWLRRKPEIMVSFVPGCASLYCPLVIKNRDRRSSSSP